jgi:cytochrome P450
MQISDITSPAFYADPYPFYQELLTAPILFNLMPHVWITGRYSIIDPALRDRRMGRSYMQSIRTEYGDIRAREPVFNAFERMLLMMDPPNHTRLRGLLAKAFNAKHEDGFRQLAQTIADERIDSFIHSMSADIMQDYALPIPIAVICTLLDLPYDDVSILSDAVDAIVQSFEAATMRDEQIDAANLAMLTLEKYFTPILLERRKKPGDDLISRMILVEGKEGRLTNEEVVANIILLFIAGHETTTNMIGNALIALHRHPQQLAKIIANPSLLSNAVAECLRYDSSVQLAIRTALEDIEIGGFVIPRGDSVCMFLGSANRDPEKFDDPNQLLIERGSVDNRFLSFGGGAHHCLGARLAIIELEVALGTLFRRLPEMRITNLDGLQWHQRNALRGVKSLHATW